MMKFKYFVFFADKKTCWYARACGTERSPKKVSKAQKTNVLPKRDRKSAAQNDGHGYEAGTVMCQSFIAVKPLLEFE